MTVRRLWALAVCAALVSGVAGVQAEDAPYDERQRGHAQAVRKAGRDPRAAIELLQMQRHAGDADPNLTRELYQSLAENKRLDSQVRVQAGHRLAWDLRRLGQVEQSKAAFDALGYVRDWRLIGPFDNEGKRGWGETQPPEQRLDQPRDLAARFPGRERMVGWRQVPDSVRGGYVSFDALFHPAANVCGFAETTLVSEREQPITLWMGAGGAFKLYFNGEQVLEDAAYRGPFPNRHVAAVRARKGPNRVLVKVCVAEGNWGFYLRSADPKGEPLALASDPSLVEPVAALTGKTPKAPRTWLEVLRERADKPRARAQALADYARFLRYSAADDPAERWARAYAQRAAKSKPSVDHLLLAASLSHERHERMRLLAEAAQLEPDNRRVKLTQAALVQRGPEPERALGMLQDLGTQGVVGMNALRLRASMLTDLGMPEGALALLNRGSPRALRSRRWQWARAEALRAVDHDEQALRVTHELYERHADFVAARRVLFRSALHSGDVGAAVEHANALRALYPAHVGRLEEVARMYEAAGRDDLKFAALTDLIELNPQAPRVHVTYGRALLSAERFEAAAESLRTALALSPQDAETRELLEQLDPEPRRDESFAVDQETLLARRSPSNGHPVTVLSSLTVNTVFENGLGSRFVQYAAQAHDTEGARQLRARSIQFDPETQRVDVRLARVYRKDGRVLDATQTYVQQLGEPWYRIYYDTRALVVVFPDLEPGDSVELRYRVDDVAHRNLFADYFGDMHFFQGGEPRKHVEYVLIAPKSRKLFFNDPKMPSLKHEQRELDDGQVLYRYWADDVEPISPEPSMPGLTEVAPYLHVSTYGNWKDVARWYWGLIEDQLAADDALKNTVATLKAGADSEREIVERIYGWVIRNTRYVGLEFGIHGFLPYRVPDIVRRGFGDCKDKASLIYTMLREAGVDARIVLVRTRDNGDIEPLPASLAVFDHAIAYVPSLDLFLDGTAEHHGTQELPYGDQGVQVLIVGPNDSELRKTPVLPAERNLRERDLVIDLAEDGSAKLEASERIVGGDAAGYRGRYQARGTQAERLERSLASRYPGLTLKSHSFEGLDQLEGDVKLSYTLRVPQLAQRDGENLRLMPSVVENLAGRLARTPERSYPLEIGARSTYVENRRVLLPSGHQATRLPKGGEVRSRFGQLSLEVEQHGEEVRARTRLEMNTNRVAPEDYDAFRRWVQQADQLLQQRITISPKKP